MALPPSSTAALAPRRVPEAYLRAELATFPLTSLDAFRAAIVALDPAVPGGSTTLQLWRACEERLVEHASGWSLDRMIAVRDFTWFIHDTPPPHERQQVRLHRYLRHLARAHLEAEHGVTEVREDPAGTSLDMVNHYRWLSFAVPEDLLLAALPIDPPPTRVSIEDPLMVRRLLDHGVAEIHQHVGAGLDFPLLWASAMAALADPDLDAALLSGPAVPFGDGELLLRWLLVAAVARIALAEFLLTRPGAGGEGRGFRRFLHDRTHSPARLRQRLTLAAALTALVVAPQRQPPEFARLQHLYGELHPLGERVSRERPASIEQAWRTCDPIAVRLGLSAPNAAERWLVRHGLAYLESDGGGADAWFTAAFWQTIRLRCAFYRYVVQRPLTAGLQWFIRYSGRIGLLRGPLRNLRPEMAYRVAGGGDKIAALEARTTGDDSALGLADQMLGMVASWRHVLDAYRGSFEPEFGVVLDFIKTRDRLQLWPLGQPKAFGRGSHAEPQLETQPAGAFKGFDGHGARFSSFLREQAAFATAAGELLCAVPLTLWLIRGIDVANDELGVPTWALTPLYHYVRQEAAFASVLPLRDVAAAPTLRATAHVGEDFRHLMEGLRRIYEAIVYLLGPSGGRIGHATALGMEPRAWAESVGAVLMPAEDRLWDLVFEWRMYTGFQIASDFRAAAPAGREARLANEIRILSERIFARAYEPHQIAQLHDDLHRFMLPEVGRAMPPHAISVDHGLRAFRRRGRSAEGNATLELLEKHLRWPEAFRRGQELVDIAVDSNEIAALAAVQEALRRGVAGRGIVVEVNPSSNLLIGDLLDLRRHPILRLFPVEREAGAAPVPIAIGSDDPITFSTSLLREYALLYQAARAAGYSERDIHAWLEAIRQTSMDARFTLAWPPNATDMADRLMRELSRYLQRPVTVLRHERR